MTNKELVAAATKHLEKTTVTGKAYVASGRPPSSEWGQGYALLAQVQDIAPAPADSLVPTGLSVESVGEVQVVHLLRTWVGRSVTISGRGPAGRRVEVIDLNFGLCGGDEIAADGTWRLPTTPLPLGTTRQLVARSILRDGTGESVNSVSVEAVIPPA